MDQNQFNELIKNLTPEQQRQLIEMFEAGDIDNASRLYSESTGQAGLPMDLLDGGKKWGRTYVGPLSPENVIPQSGLGPTTAQPVPQPHRGGQRGSVQPRWRTEEPRSPEDFTDARLGKAFGSNQPIIPSTDLDEKRQYTGPTKFQIPDSGLGIQGSGTLKPRTDFTAPQQFGNIIQRPQLEENTPFLNQPEFTAPQQFDDITQKPQLEEGTPFLNQPDFAAPQQFDDITQKPQLEENTPFLNQPEFTNNTPHNLKSAVDRVYNPGSDKVIGVDVLTTDQPSTWGVPSSKPGTAEPPLPQVQDGVVQWGASAPQEQPFIGYQEPADTFTPYKPSWGRAMETGVAEIPGDTVDFISQFATNLANTPWRLADHFKRIFTGRFGDGTYDPNAEVGPFRSTSLGPATRRGMESVYNNINQLRGSDAVVDLDKDVAAYPYHHLAGNMADLGLTGVFALGKAGKAVTTPVVKNTLDTIQDVNSLSNVGKSKWDVYDDAAELMGSATPTRLSSEVPTPPENIVSKAFSKSLQSGGNLMESVFDPGTPNLGSAIEHTTTTPFPFNKSHLGEGVTDPYNFNTDMSTMNIFNVLDSPRELVSRALFGKAPEGRTTHKTGRMDAEGNFEDTTSSVNLEQSRRGVADALAPSVKFAVDTLDLPRAAASRILFGKEPTIRTQFKTGNLKEMQGQPFIQDRSPGIKTDKTSWGIAGAVEPAVNYHAVADKLVDKLRFNPNIRTNFKTGRLGDDLGIQDATSNTRVKSTGTADIDAKTPLRSRLLKAIRPRMPYTDEIQDLLYDYTGTSGWGPVIANPSGRIENIPGRTQRRFGSAGIKLDMEDTYPSIFGSDTASDISRRREMKKTLEAEDRLQWGVARPDPDDGTIIPPKPGPKPTGPTLSQAADVREYNTFIDNQGRLRDAKGRFAKLDPTQTPSGQLLDVRARLSNAFESDLNKKYNKFDRLETKLDDRGFDIGFNVENARHNFGITQDRFKQIDNTTNLRERLDTAKSGLKSFKPSKSDRKLLAMQKEAEKRAEKLYRINKKRGTSVLRNIDRGLSKVFTSDPAMKFLLGKGYSTDELRKLQEYSDHAIAHLASMHGHTGRPKNLRK